MNLPTGNQPPQFLRAYVVAPTTLRLNVTLRANSWSYMEAMKGGQAITSFGVSVGLKTQSVTPTDAAVRMR